jgi:two-component system OmpR family response regulator
MNLPPQEASSTVPNLASGASILVVDEDGQILQLVARFLRSNGFRVHTARDGREMQTILAETGADLIVLDLMLPGANGLDLCREVRRGVWPVKVWPRGIRAT